MCNSPQDTTQSTCHPRTRESILNDIFNWINATNTREAWILWLKGAAGSGKTTIARSVVKLCEEKSIPVVKYFFHNNDPPSNTIATVVSTLAYQIIQLVPDTKIIITQTIDRNPLIFNQSFEYQLEMLVIKPLQQIFGSASGVDWKLLLVLDGLDECINGRDCQVLLIHAVAKYLAARSPQIIAIISSREERHLTMAFNARSVDSVLFRLCLGNYHDTDRDLRHYLVDCFDDIKKTHPARNHIDRSWPASSQIDDILSEASGQFIYASAVINFVSSPYSHPPDQLEVILGNHGNQRGSAAPFEELDELFLHIFSQMDKSIINLSITILATVVLENITSVSQVSSLLKIPATTIYSALAGLASIIEFRDNHIVFQHSSLRKFLLDRSRSKQYCINSIETPGKNPLKRPRVGEDHESRPQDSAKRRCRKDTWHPGNNTLAESNLNLEQQQELENDGTAMKTMYIGKQHLRPQLK